MMKKKVSTTKKSKVSDKIVDGLENFANQLEKSTDKIIKNRNKIKNVKLVMFPYKNMRTKKIGLSLFLNKSKSGQVLDITDDVFSDYNEVADYLDSIDIVVSLSRTLKDNIKESRIMKKQKKPMESGIDSIEYLDQQDQLRKFNLK
jgi:hypothetical protein